MTKKIMSLAVLSALTAANSYAQTTTQNESDTNFQLEEVVVTATRRATTLADTPVAVTALSADALRAGGVSDPTELSTFVPNLSVDRANGGLSFSIRGIVSGDTTEKGDPSVAFMTDDVVIARPWAQEVSLFDVERIEVLRGPQGTLFGRNTTGGAVNVITAKPNFDGLTGRVDVVAGDYGTQQATGVINVPVTDSLAFRGAVNFEKRDNYVDAGPATQGNIDEFKDNRSIRLSGLYQQDRLEVALQLDKSQIKGSGFDLLPISNFYQVDDQTDSVDPVRIAGNGSDSLRNNTPIPWENEKDNSDQGVRLAVSHEFDPVVVNYIGSVRQFERDEVDSRITANADAAYYTKWDGEFDQTSHEVRFASNSDGPLSWQVGGFYFKEESDIELKLILAPGVAPVVGGDEFTIGFFQNPTINESIGYFGQATYELTDKARVTLGARYSEDEKSRVGYQALGNGFYALSPADGVAPNNNADVSFDKTTWKLGLDYDLNEDTMIYANVSSGYKAGGFNDGCVIGTGPGCSETEDTFFYDPEDLINYEAGIKSRLLDNRLSVDAVAFMYDYSDIQLTAIADCGGANCMRTQNGGEAEVKGFELESRLRASENDEIQFALTLLESEYTDYVKDEDHDFTGEPLDRSPKWTMTLGYQRFFGFDSGAEVVAAITTKVSDSYVIHNPAFNNFYSQPEYSKTNLTLTYNSSDEKWYVQGYAKNL